MSPEAGFHYSELGSWLCVLAEFSIQQWIHLEIATISPSLKILLIKILVSKQDPRFTEAVQWQYVIN